MSRRHHAQPIDDLQAKLPPFVPYKLVSGVDRYGFSSVLATRCGRNVTRRSFANWVHGWVWAEEPSAELLACANLPRDLTIVVRNLRERIALENEGFRDVRIGGLPFAYVARQHTSRYMHGLLAFPPHSAEAEKVSSDQTDYLDYLESLKNDFEVIYVSIYYLDLNGPMHKAAQARGLRIIQGARPDDANSLQRMRALFDAFSTVTSNVIGSHVLYALYSGCRFSFSGPFYAYTATDFLGNGNPHDHEDAYIESLVMLHSERYLRDQFGSWFADHPKAGALDQAFASDAIGEAFLMSARQIDSAMGWDLPGRLRGYFKGAKRRLARAVAAQGPSAPQT